MYFFFFWTKIWLFIFVHQKSWKLAFKTGFSVHNIHLYLCWQVEDTKWILCYRKIGVESAYLRFLMYKSTLLFECEVKKHNITIKLLNSSNINSTGIEGEKENHFCSFLKISCTRLLSDWQRRRQGHRGICPYIILYSSLRGKRKRERKEN